MPAARRVRALPRAGSSKANAIAVDLEDSDGDLPAVSAASSRRTKPAINTSSNSQPARQRPARHSVTDSDDSSSDAPYVATSARPSAAPALRDKGKGKAREVQPDEKTRAREDAPKATRSPPKKQRSIVNKVQVTTDEEDNRRQPANIDRLPTPVSLITDSSAEPEPSRRLVKADRTPARAIPLSDDEPELIQTSPPRPSFAERLQANSAKKFSKSFRNKVKSGPSSSIPLNDERFGSSEEDEPEDIPVQRSSGKRKARRPSPEAGNETTESELPEVPRASTSAAKHASSGGRQQYREGLGELTERRKSADKRQLSHEKRRKRIAATPSPSPEPIVVAASRSAPASTPRSKGKGRINVRAISSSGGKPKRRQKPLFRNSDDEYESTDHESKKADVNADTDTSGAVRNAGKTKKGKPTAAAPPSSSSSSSSSSSAESVVSEDSEIDEDIALDYDPVVQDKLRPKNNARAHKLDALKAKRAAKEVREQRRKRGIIESDDDDSQATSSKKNSIAESDDEDDGGEASSSSGSEEFIVPDDGDIDPDELERAERLMPTEFGSHGRLDLEGHFSVFVAFIVFQYFLPKSREFRNRKEFTFSKHALENAINGLVNGSVASAIWREDFRRALDRRPNLEMYTIGHAPGCEGCDKMDRTASKVAILKGQPYDPLTLKDIEEHVNGTQEFALGNFCAEKAEYHHALRHALKINADTIRKKCRKLNTLGTKLMGGKEEKREQRCKEAERVINILVSGQNPLQRMLWLELDQTMERAKHKFLK